MTKLHEREQITSWIERLRVPGGWLYHAYNNASALAFVPDANVEAAKEILRDKNDLITAARALMQKINLSSEVTYARREREALNTLLGRLDPTWKWKPLPAGRIVAERGYGLADLAHVHTLDEGEFLCWSCQQPRGIDRPDGCRDPNCPEHRTAP